MGFPKKLDNDVLFQFIKEYADKYNQFTPSPGFLAPYFGVSRPCIHQKMKILEKRGLIKRFKKGANVTAYIVI